MGSQSSTCAASEAPTLDSLAADLSAGKFKNVVVMCGAGCSTSAGIPDFRTPSAGLYFKLRKYNLPYPEAIFDGSYFRKDPKPFYGLVREIYPERLCPTTTHKFFRLLHDKGILTRVYTQNIDALEFLVGLPEEKVVEAHGTFQRSYCTSTVCGKKFDLPWLKRELFSPDTNDGVPKCPSCQNVVRPDVVLFGEALPTNFWKHSARDFSNCDLLLVFGTSLTVAPFNSLVAKPAKGVPRVYVNRTKPGAAGGLVGWLLGMGRSVSFNEVTDLVVLGDCDETVTTICGKASWQQELEQVQFQVMEP